MKLHAIALLAICLACLPALAAPGPRPNNEVTADLCSAANILFDHAADVQSKDPTAAKPLFARAAREYEAVLSQPLSQSAQAEVLTNAGAAHHLSGDLGLAMLDLRRAELLSPATPNLRERLLAARAALKSEAATPTSATAPVHDTGIWELTRSLALSAPRQWLWRIAAIGYVCFWSTLLIRLLLPSPGAARIGPAWLIALGTLCVIPAIALAGMHVRDVDAQSQAVVLVESIGRAEPDNLTGVPSSPAPFKPGTELRILDERVGGDGRSWLRVAQADASPAPDELPIWIPEAVAARVAPSHFASSHSAPSHK